MRQCNLWKGIAVTIPDEPVSLYVLAIIYAGDVVFAVSGALTAGRHRMDILGFALIGTITGSCCCAWLLRSRPIFLSKTTSRDKRR
jgi:uncharacterized membrane protein YeiH